MVEADESDASFLQYPTEIAVITNIEADHLVIWGTPEAYAKGFRTFATQPHVRHVETQLVFEVIPGRGLVEAAQPA